MKHLSFLFSDKREYKEAKKEAKKSLYSSELIQIFTSLTDKTKIQKLLLKIAKDFPNALVIGTTTAGEITHAKMYDKTTVLSITLFKKAKLKTAYAKNINTKSGKKLSKTLACKSTKAAIVFSEGLQGSDYEGFIKGIKQVNPKIIIAGGLAGDNFELKRTFVFLGVKIYDTGSVAVSFSGKKLFADNRYNLNWTPIGKEFTITKSEGNLVKEIDNEDATLIFKRYLGESSFDNSASELSNFPLLFKKDSTVVSRIPIAVEGNAIIFAGPLKEGQKVQFGFSNASSVLSGSTTISKSIHKNPAEAIFIYSCIARKTLLGKVLENEFKQFESIAPTAGFFTYGEFYSTTANNVLLNCTTTILVLSEDIKHAKPKQDFYEEENSNLENSTFNALTHFIKQTSMELDKNLRLLNEYKNVVDASSIVSKADANGTITYINENFCRISKYSKNELLGQKHSVVRDPHVSGFIFKKMWNTILSGKVWKGVISNRAKDGSIYYVNATIMPIFDANAKIKEFIAIRQDVTKQIESKKRLKEKEKLIKAIFDNQDSIVLLASRTKGMQNANKKLFHYLNFKNLEDFRSQHKCICDLFIEEDGYIYTSKFPNWINDIAEDEGDRDNKVKILTKDGVVRTFNLMVKSIDDLYIINLYDISNLENAILKANASESAKSTFLSNMSHEIRTPLNGILGFTDVLTKRDLDKDSKRYVDIIHKSGQTLLSVVNDILDFSKIESGELSIDEIESNLFLEMEAAISTFASLSRSKGIDYYVYIDPKIPKTLLCDVQRIKQVINNLVSNAMKFTPKNGSVGVNITLESTSDKKAKINFSITDSGIGIAKDKLPTIFKAFSQADNSISREFGGTGLGLAISNQYVNMMGTTIQVQSKEGEGSEFSFTLELQIINSQDSLVYKSSDSSVHINILYSQEDKEVCSINDIVTTYLKAWNYQYVPLKNIEDIHQDATILIVCSKLFDKEACLKLLNNLHDLQLLYIEGTEDNFQYTHKKFHLISQPMTGSSLFDKLVTLSGGDVSHENTEVTDKTARYMGKVLIAEDNQTNQMLITIMLQDRGVDYKVVNNGQEALDEIAQNDTYDLILMDINMPVLDGVSATKELRKTAYTKPIVSLSANVIENDAITFKEAGVNETLNKPIVPHELDEVLGRYLQAEKEVSFDTVNVERISKDLSIKNTEIVLKLLKSFSKSIQEMLIKLQTEPLEEDLIHNLKGMSGNLRFDKLYAFSIELEKLAVGEYEIHKELLMSHLSNLIKQIELSDK